MGGHDRSCCILKNYNKLLALLNEKKADSDDEPAKHTNLMVITKNGTRAKERLHTHECTSAFYSPSSTSPPPHQQRCSWARPSANMSSGLGEISFVTKIWWRFLTQMILQKKQFGKKECMLMEETKLEGHDCRFVLMREETLSVCFAKNKFIDLWVGL